MIGNNISNGPNRQSKIIDWNFASFTLNGIKPIADLLSWLNSPEYSVSDEERDLELRRREWEVIRSEEELIVRKKEREKQKAKNTKSINLEEQIRQSSIKQLVSKRTEQNKEVDHKGGASSSRKADLDKELPL